MTDLRSSSDELLVPATDDSDDSQSDDSEYSTSAGSTSSASTCWSEESSSSRSASAAPVPVDEPTAESGRAALDAPGPSQTDATTYYAPIYSVQWNWIDRAPHGRLPRSRPPRQPPPWPITPLLRIHGMAPPPLASPRPLDLDELR